MLDEFGEYDIDLQPFFGDNIAGEVASTTVFGGRPGANILTEADGYVHHGNQVVISLIPRMSHGGLSLEGTIERDKIRGSWLKRDYAPTESGRFIMVRRGD